MADSNKLEPVASTSTASASSSSSSNKRKASQKKDPKNPPRNVAATTTVSTSSSSSSNKPKASQKKDPKSPPTKASHPPVSVMLIDTIASLNKKGGSSLHAIKKNISDNYMVDAEKLSVYIRKHLKSAVASGVLIQTSGKGASGSFKLSKKDLKSEKKAKKSEAEKTEKKTAPPKKKKLATTEKPKAASVSKKTKGKEPLVADTEKKVTSGKRRRSVAEEASPTADSKKKAAKPKTISKGKKTAKLPTKPKTPLPKKVKSFIASSEKASTVVRKPLSLVVKRRRTWSRPSMTSTPHK